MRSRSVRSSRSSGSALRAPTRSSLAPSASSEQEPDPTTGIETNALNERPKDEYVRRALRGIAKQKSREDYRKLKEKARERKARKTHKPRRNDWREQDDDGAEAFERIRPSERVLGHAAPKPGAGAEPAAPRDPHERAGAPTTPALVLALARGAADVLAEGVLVRADLDGPLAATQQTSLAVGDRVRLRARAGAAPLVVAVEPRRTTLARPDPANPARERVLAANVDVAVLVLAALEPKLRPALIDRLLVATARGGVEPAVCVNKLDLVTGERERTAIERALLPYREIGIAVHVVSAATGAGIDPLRAALAGRTCVLVGHSGVGKSSLLNRLDPQGARRVGAVRASDGKGRHTTTGSTLVELPDGTRIIDTPGIRELGLGRLDAPALRRAFPELDEPATRCRFSDCAHTREPACAVRAAVEAGTIARTRYEAYLRLLEELESGA